MTHCIDVDIGSVLSPEARDPDSDRVRMIDDEVHARVEQERQMLGNEVHDSVAQSITSVRMRMTMLRDAIARGDPARAGALATDIDTAIAGVQSGLREIITHFRGAMAAPDLVSALEIAIDELRVVSEVEIDFTNLLGNAKLSAYEEHQMFYIAREAITNALKYAHANCVGVLLIEEQGHIELMVTDNGIGLEQANVRQQGHFGLRIMQERARRLGGTLAVEPCPCGGTRVRLVIPCCPPISGEDA